MTGSQALLVVIVGKSRDAQRINNKLKYLLCVCTQESGLETQTNLVKEEIVFTAGQDLFHDLVLWT